MQTHSQTISDGDRVLIITEKKKRYLVQVRDGKKFHTSEGFVDLSNIIGKLSGCSVASNTGARMLVFKPTITDVLMFLPRTTQIVYPKDLGYIVAASGVGPGSVVLEAGTGTGVLAAFLANMVRPLGKVYSYDIKLENIQSAAVKLRALGLDEFIELKHGDISAGVEERNVDAAVIDVPEPWTAVKPCREALKPGGVWVSLSPTIEQVVQTFEAMEGTGFADLSCVELLLRNIRVKRGMTRPEFLMRGHTAYIVTARKTVD
ncbi:MAG: tRNA (adenine-N1)-methyltransferase [Candidatus Caldarchaeum sp.]|nr:tRNA (adenine-N1)-methyltransferase [Candidatus Caldarchaeum sp.]